MSEHLDESVVASQASAAAGLAFQAQRIEQLEEKLAEYRPAVLYLVEQMNRYNDTYENQTRREAINAIFMQIHSLQMKERGL